MVTACSSDQQQLRSEMRVKTGFGYDIHKLQPGTSLCLGGVNIKSDYSIVAHSDGDIVFHSLANALLSSVGAEDIGYFFPDNTTATEGMSSLKILEFALDKVIEKGYKISNAVVDIVLEKTKLNPHREELKKSIASALRLGCDDVAVHFNTNEKMDSVGRSEAIIVYSVVTIYKE